MLASGILDKASCLGLSSHTGKPTSMEGKCFGRTRMPSYEETKAVALARIGTVTHCMEFENAFVFIGADRCRNGLASMKAGGMTNGFAWGTEDRKRPSTTLCQGNGCCLEDAAIT